MSIESWELESALIYDSNTNTQIIVQSLVATYDIRDSTTKRK